MPRTRTLTLDIDAEPPQWPWLSIRAAKTSANKVASALAAVVDLPAPRTAATLVLAGDARMRALNKQWRGYDKPTNVLSFPSLPPPKAARANAAHHLGDVIIAGETVVREAADLGISAGDHYRHLVLHGLLHLLGYDHEADGEAAEMEALETRVLATLGVADPYADSDPVPASKRRKPVSRKASRR